jgi:Fic family protein
MEPLTPKQQRIITILQSGENFSSSEIHSRLLEQKMDVSLVTIKRTIAEMLEHGLVATKGAGPSTTYTISTRGRIGSSVDAHAYCSVEPDKRAGMSIYNFDLFPEFPKNIFSAHEFEILETATTEYGHRTEGVTPTIQKKELERLVIELSWKSSRIEGNTYTLLDTEKLILEHTVAPGKTKEETKMILNHKDAFTFIHEHKHEYKILSRANIEHIHILLTQDLNIDSGLRKHAVGVLGSKYLPLDNMHQIRDAFEQMIQAVNRAENPYTKALLALLGISYIQAFGDGNKRTGRLVANAILMAHGRASLSYRSVEEETFREAMLVFYELNFTTPMKQIFIDQYQFATKNYAVR